MKIVYQAGDGALFDNEIECRDYEWSRKIYNALSEKKITMLTYNMEIMREKDSLNHRKLNSLIEDIYYFRCNDEEVLEILSEFFAEDFEKNVIYYYDEEDMKWIELDDFIYNYQSFLNDLIKAKTLIMDGITT